MKLVKIVLIMNFVLVGIVTKINSYQIQTKALYIVTSSKEKIIHSFKENSVTSFLVMTENSIQLKRNSGDQIWSKNFDRKVKAVIPKTGSYFGVIVHDSKIAETFNYQVFNLNSTPKYNFQLQLYHDNRLPIVCLSGMGESAIIRPENNHLTLLSKNGAVLFDGKFTDNIISSLEKNVNAEYSSDGKFFAVTGMQRPATFDESSQKWISGLPVLVLIDRTGKILWENKLPGDFNQQVIISPSGNFIVTVSYGFSGNGLISAYCLVFDRSGNTVFQDDFFHNSVDFSTDEKFLLRQNRKKVQLLELKSSKIIFEYSFPENIGTVEAIRLSQNGEKIACLTGENIYKDKKFQLQNVKLWLLNVVTGKVEYFSIADFFSQPVKLDFEKDSQNFLIQSEGTIIKFEENK